MSSIIALSRAQVTGRAEFSTERLRMRAMTYVNIPLGFTVYDGHDGRVSLIH